MNGRNGPSFVTSNRVDDAKTLVKRMQEGLVSQKYKQVDYAQLKAAAAQKRAAGEQKLQKVQKLKDASKQGKDNHLVKQHRAVWKRELNRLKHAEKMAQVELDFHTRQNATDGAVLAGVFSEFEEAEVKLERGRDKFQKATVEPVDELREDLKYWLRVYSGDIVGPAVEQEHARVHDTIQSVKDQQYDLLNRLQREAESTQRELNEGWLGELAQPADLSVQHGIPIEAFDLDCPDEDLKANVLQEFILLDDRYVERLDRLEQEYATAICNETGGWLEEEHRLFIIILEQYTHELGSNRRMLYIDRLKREFPHKTRSQIVAHEEWWMLWHFYHERRRDLIHDWRRDRLELLNRVKVVFADACSQFELEKTKAEHVDTQQELRRALYEKVGEWRTKKLEALQLQAELAEQQLRVVMEKQREEEEREQQRREHDRRKIAEYKHEQQRLRKEQEDEQKLRLRELQEQLAQQAQTDHERVKFREEKFKEKVDEKRKREANKETEKEEQEKRLEALRETVRPQVEGDLLRVWSDTKAWHSRTRGKEEVSIQQPLYNINTFTAKQVTSDPRYKFEQKLRAAGLHDNKYARDVMLKMPGSQPARRDTHSTVFKH